MTSPCSVLVEYMPVRSGSCVCLFSMYVQNLLAAHAFAVVGLHSLPSVFDYFFGSPFFYGLPHLGAGPCLTVDFAFLQPTLFLLPSPAMPLHHSCYEVVYLNPAGSLWACRLFFSQWLSTAISSFITSPAGSCVPFVFSWAFLAHLLSLGFLGLFLNFTFSWAFTEFFGLLRPNCIIPHP